MRTDSPRSVRIEAAGLVHHLLEWEGEGPSLVLLHGYLDCAASFSALAAALPPDLHVIAPDFRGHGESGRVGAGGWYHFPDYARDLRALVDARARGPVRLVGHSMGGSVALLFAGAWPRDVERLVLLEGLGPPDEDLADGPARLARWVAELGRIEAQGRTHPAMPSSEAAAARLLRSNPRLSPEEARRLAEGLARPDGRGGWAWKHDPLHRARTPTIFRWERVRPFAEAVACPVLLVAGGKSWYVARDLSDRRACLRDARLLELPEAGHMLHQDAPTEVASAIAVFVAGGEPEGARSVGAARGSLPGGGR